LPNLLIRDLQPDLERELKNRAKETGESLSSVAQKLMRRGMSPETQRKNFGIELRNLVAKHGFVELEIERDKSSRRPPDFS
jgi:plasmid stability protein